ncbi:MAG: GyrI-like domain-containing protein [Sporomusaceae bacterium]|nr:GyrI-like domain-containing protein [Sporomusaceae bacterium]
MPRISSFEILEKEAQPAISIRTRSQAAKLPQVIGEGYGKLAAYLKESGKFLADAPYVAYHNMDMQDLDVEMAFPLAAPLPGTGDIQATSTPKGKLVICMYRGPYHKIEPTYHEMIQWITGNALQPVGSSYEYYWNSPTNVPEDDLLTLLAMPVG